MKKLMIASALAAVAFGGMNAQVVNRALEFTPEGKVDCGAMPKLDDLRSYSVQFWFNPTSWSQDATLMSRGNDFAVKLGVPGNLRFINGDTEATATSDLMKTGEWTQVTMICNDGNAEILIDGEKAGEGLVSGLGKSEAPFVLGGNYTGLLDEVRIWDAPLDEMMKTFDYFTNNTLNKWCPMWDNLVAYYKMDQENCPALVDYKGIEEKEAAYDNHGVISSGVSRVEAFNHKLPYLINSAYTNNERFYDRIIPREQYLLSNEVIILGVDVYASDGHLELKTPNYHATGFSGTEYMQEFGNRKGVLSFDGSSSMTLPAEVFTANNPYTFETWIYLDEWTPGAYILRKENEDKTEGLAIYLSEEADNRIIVRVNGKSYCSEADATIPVGTWTYFAITPGSNSSVSATMSFFKNTRKYNCDGNSELTTGEAGVVNTYISETSAEYPVVLGENLKGKLDDTAIWGAALGSGVVTGHRTNVPMPGLDRTVTVANMQDSRAFYRYDDPEELGFSSHSQDNWLKIMKSAYDGHAGVNFYISVQGKYSNDGVHGDWRNILNSPEKRARFVSDLATISGPYDGVELDLEWLENRNNWEEYFRFCDEIKAGLPEGKEFRVSTHQAYIDYILSSASKSKDFDGFTWQQYGPNANLFQYNAFENAVKRLLNNGFDPSKTLTSYSTTTSQGVNKSAVIGVKGDVLNTYEPATVAERNRDEYTTAKDTWYYMGPMQVYARAKFTRENKLQGIFYWDMGNDNWEGTAASPEMAEYNQAKYCSYGINANNDTIVTDLSIHHYGEASVKKIEKDQENKDINVVVSQGGEYVEVTFSLGDRPKEIRIYSMSGSLAGETRMNNRIYIENLPAGVYMISAIDSQGIRHNKKFVKK